MVKLIDPQGDYEEVISRRNVDVVDQPACGETKTFNLTVYNDKTTAVTVERATESIASIRQSTDRKIKNKKKSGLQNITIMRDTK